MCSANHIAREVWRYEMAVHGRAYSSNTETGRHVPFAWAAFLDCILTGEAGFVKAVRGIALFKLQDAARAEQLGGRHRLLWQRSATDNMPTVPYKHWRESLVEVMTPVTMLGQRAIAAAKSDEARDRSAKADENMGMNMERNLENGILFFFFFAVSSQNALWKPVLRSMCR